MADRIEMAARPETIALKPSETAVIVVDMQNAYASKGGYIDLLGVDVSGSAQVIEAIQSVLPLSRQLGMPIVFLQNGWDAALHEAGGPGSPHWYKSNALKLMRERSELDGTLTIKGTWDYDFVDALQPQPTDLVVAKPRYSGFWGTNLDMLLRARGIRNLIFTGVATNVCVESTLRDAFFLEYFAVLLSDATLHIGPDWVREATLFNVETFFGWVTTTAEYRRAVQALQPVGATA